MKVLSLFDGISCGHIALDRAGIKVERYVAYEIEKSAIKITQANYPETEQGGDVFKADFTQYKGFDLLIGGSPLRWLPRNPSLSLSPLLRQVYGSSRVRRGADRTEKTF